MDDTDLARWQGGVDAKLDALLSRVDSVATSKDTAHAALHARIDTVEGRTDNLEGFRDRALGVLIGVGIGAGAVGGGVGALVSSFLA